MKPDSCLKSGYFCTDLSLYTPESPSSLLVHLCSWCHTIHSHEENLARLDDPEENLQVMEDVCKNLFLRDAKVDVLVIGMGTLVDNPIHVQIQIVKLWDLKNRKG